MTERHETPRSFLWFFREVADLRYRRIAAGSVLLMLLGTIAETLGIGAILPVLYLASGSLTEDKSGIAEAFGRVFSYFGGQPSLELLLLIVVVAMVIKALISLAGEQMIAAGGAKMVANLRMEFIETLLASRWSYLVQQETGGIANAISGEAVRAGRLFKSMVRTISSGLSAIPFLILAMVVSVPLTLGAAGVAIIIMLLLKHTLTQTRRYSADLSQTSHFLVTRLVDSILTVKPLKAMALQDLVLPYLHDRTIDLVQAERRQNLSKVIHKISQEPLLVIAICTGLYFGTTDLDLEFAEVAFMLVLFQRSVTHLLNVQSQLQSVASSEAAYLRLKREIDTAREAKEGIGGTANISLHKSIEFRNVTFSYPEHTVFEGLNLKLPAGKTIALVGPSGSGKTSLADLVTGLQSPQEGQVLIDGSPLETVDIVAWRNRIGYVPQEFQLLNNTIYENLTLGDKACSRADAQHALEMAGAWNFVSELPQGLQTVVGERGAFLSGGQRQRIAIARAMIRSPDLLILDEATSALDPATEKEICRTLIHLPRSVTVIMISHQPAVAKIADYVVSVECGHVDMVRAQRQKPLLTTD